MIYIYHNNDRNIIDEIGDYLRDIDDLCHLKMDNGIGSDVFCDMVQLKAKKINALAEHFKNTKNNEY